MKAFRKHPGEGWELIEVENTLEALQKQVGGTSKPYRSRKTPASSATKKAC